MAFTDFIEIPFISRDGNSYKAIIQKDGLYNIQTLKGTSSPVNIAFADGAVTDLKSMCGQKMDIGFLPKEYNQYPDFFTTELFAYKGILKKDETTVWEGWMIPELYQANHGGSRKIKVSFRCGLAILKFFEIESLNLNLEKKITLWEVIHKSLLQIGHNLPISVFSSISHEGSTGANFFKSTYFRPEIYEGENLYKILEDLLKGFRLTQDWITVDGGSPLLCWTLIDYGTLMDLDSFTPELYNSDGSISALAVAVVENSSQFGSKVSQNLEAFPSITYEKGVNKVEFNTKMKSRNLINNPGFTDLVTPGIPDDWTRSLSISPSISTYNLDKTTEEEPFVEFSGEKLSTKGNESYIQQFITFPVEESPTLNGKQLILSFEHATFYESGYNPDGNSYTFGVRISSTFPDYITPRFGVLENTVGEESDGISIRSTTTPTIMEFPYNENYSPKPTAFGNANKFKPDYQKVELNLFDLNPSFLNYVLDYITLQIRFYAPTSNQNNDPTIIHRIKNVQVKYIKAFTGDELTPVEEVSFGSGKLIRSIDTSIGTALSGEKPGYAFGGALTWNDSGTHKTIRSWNIRGLAFDTYQEMISQLHLKLFKENPQILDATIRNSSKWRKRLIHTHDLRSFLFSGASWNVQKAKVSGQMMGLKTFHTPDPDQLNINDADQLEINEDSNETNAIN